MKKAHLVLPAVLLASLSFSNASYATTESDPTTSSVSSITLKADGPGVSWTLNGTSSMGFKLVWSKNTGPTYPTRDGDKYHYLSDSSARKDKLEAFSGAGTYYVRVCEYLGGKCGTYSNEVSVALDGSMKEKEMKEKAKEKAKEVAKKNKEKILRIEDVKYFKNIEKIGDSLYGNRIADAAKKEALERKVAMLKEQMKKLQDQLDELNKQLSTQ